MSIVQAHNDQKYIDALLNNNAPLIEEIYQKWHKEVLNFVKKNNGNEQDADDLFQESLMAIIRRARKGGLVLTVPFGGYFYFIYKNRWLDKLRKSDKEQVIKQEVERYNDESKTFALDTSINEDRFQLYKRCFEQLSENCRELLRLTFEKLSRKEIMERLGYASENSVNQRIHRCKGNLNQLIKKQPAYRELKASNKPS